MIKPLLISCKSVFFLVMAGIILPSALHAQNTLEAGLSGGYSYYNGDIVPATPFVMPKPAFGAVVRYNFGDRWTAKITYTHAKVAGDDAKTEAVKNRNLNFTTTIDDISVTGEFNFMKYSTGSMKHKFTPYITAGAGFFFFKPTGNQNGQIADLRSLGTEGQNIDSVGRKPYKKYNFAAIFGIGFKYSLSKRFGLSAEWNMHRTFTDYLDDVSKTYYSYDKNTTPLEKEFSDPTHSHKAGEQRGNSGTKDWFSVANISVTYKIEFNNKKGCNNLRW